MVTVAACSSANHASSSSDAGADGKTPDAAAPSCEALGTCDAGLTGSGSAADDAGGGDSAGVSVMFDGSPQDGCTTYSTAWKSITDLRFSESQGCYELDNVVTLGVTPGPTYQMFVQDAAGGPISALEATCSTGGSYPCFVSAAVAAIPAGHSVTLKGLFVDIPPLQSIGFFIDSVTDNGPAATVPAPLSLSLGDVAPQQGSLSNPANVYQRVTVTIPTDLPVYDWSPPEFAVAGATHCPYQLGFALIDPSAGESPGAPCTGTGQPAALSAPSSQEVLVGTDFAPAFSASTDCRCASNPLGTGTAVTKLSGILMWGQPGPQGFLYVAPQTNADITFE